MKERITKIGRTLRRPRYGIPLAIVLIFVVIGIARSSGAKKPAFETRAVTRTSVVQEVDATGNVKSAQDVDLAFETGGKVASIRVKVGDHAAAGQTLASLSNADVAANLQSAEAKLSELEQGARPEDVAVSAANVTSAQAGVANAAATLANAVNDAYSKADDAVRNHSDQLFNSPDTNPSYGTSITSGGTTYVVQAPDSSSGFKLANERTTVGTVLSSWPQTTAGGDVATAGNAAQNDLVTVQNFLNDVAGAVNTLSSPTQSTSDVYAGVKTEVSTARSEVSTALANLRAAIQAYASAQSALDVSQKQQALKQAPAASGDIEIQQATVDLARAAYGKTVITAPFSGLITKVTPSAGEVVSPNSPAISMISDSQLQVEVNIPEADIPKVTLGAEADVTFDAYGKDFVATSTVISIDPAATVIESVPTYRTVLAFSTSDARIKSGLTANVVIHGQEKDNVLAVPQRSVITVNGQKIVQVLQGKANVNKPVETGLRGSDGNVEITSGLSEGEQYVVTPQSE